MRTAERLPRAAELEIWAAEEPFRSGLDVAGLKAQDLWRIEEVVAREWEREELLTPRWRREDTTQER